MSIVEPNTNPPLTSFYIVMSLFPIAIVIISAVR